MKKLFFILITSFLFANNYTSIKYSKKYYLYPIIPKNCYDLIDIPFFNNGKYLFSNKISTKNVNENFYLMIIKNPKCVEYKVEKIELYDEDTNETISKGIMLGNIVYFNIKDIHKRVRGKIFYKNFFDEEKEDLSSDNFAIKPQKFIIKIPKIFIENYPKHFIVTTDKNYSNDKFDISLTKNIKFKYILKIVNGKSINASQIGFKKDGKARLIIKEKLGFEFAKVDENDTLDKYRLIKGKSEEFKILKQSKGWAGIGNNSNYSVEKRTNKLNADNILIFKKVNW